MPRGRPSKFTGRISLDNIEALVEKGEEEFQQSKNFIHLSEHTLDKHNREALNIESFCKMAWKFLPRHCGITQTLRVSTHSFLTAGV
jgi:hypothetical protein